MIARALMSVSNKKGIVDFAKELSAMKVEILSTGGTAKALRDAGVPVVEVSDYTGFPEMLEGRLKTLHPKIHGGLLSRRSNPGDMQDIEKHGIKPIDMVVVNLYPFEETVAKPGVTFDEAVENIDIGGPTMLRAASKNFQDVAVVVDPEDYGVVLQELKGKGHLSRETKLNLAKKVFAHTARYDTLIADYLAKVTEKERSFPDYFTFSLKRVASLRYGENPTQKAAIYKEKANNGLSLPDARVLQGKEMSFNNYLDTHSALLLALEFDKKACAIIKHNNPCGVALGDMPADAYRKAAKTDPVSAFGGVVAFNTEVDEEAAKEMADLFLEVVIAPSFTKGALTVFSKKPNVRLLEMRDMLAKRKPSSWDMKRIAGGLLLQEWDYSMEDILSLKAVTKRQPSADEREAMVFAWKVCKHVKSNAIVYAFRDRTIGIGIGQTKRVFSAQTGLLNAGEPAKGTVAASDGFFPFRDGIDVLHEAGVTAVVQPGGSVKDDEVIKAADEYDMSMIITGVRHFRH